MSRTPDETGAAWARPGAGDAPRPLGPATHATPAAGDAAEATLSAPAEPVDQRAASYRGSPVPREWLIAAASAVMGAVLGIGVYSAAVSGGEGGNQPLAFGAPGGRQQPPIGQGFQVPGQAPAGVAGPAANLLPRAPDFVGQVRTLVGSSLTVDTAQGSRVVQVTPETRVLLADGSEGSVTDLRRGVTAAVVTTNDPVTRELRAEAIGLLDR